MNVPPFSNEALLDWGDAGNRAAMTAAVAAVTDRAPVHHPLVIGGEEVDTLERLSSHNPCRTDQLLGTVASGGSDSADKALDAAWAAFEAWADHTPESRARVLLRAAAVLRRRRVELAALEVAEAGKSWVEADADVCEAIDFVEYYARLAVVLADDIPAFPYPGEDNLTRYLPLGAGVALPPWNFPLAILTGMVAGPIAVGNTMVMKPAPETPLIAWELMAAFQEAGLPAGVCNYVPGGDLEVGEHLVTHPLTRFINFTGSAEVGKRVYELGARVAPGQRWLKRVVTEMGGKDAIIVDETADLDAAAAGIVASAFGYQGQKCSACSRVIAVDAVYDALLGKVVALTEALRIGDAADPDTEVAAVISQAQYDKVRSYLDLAATEGRVMTGGGTGDPGGWYVLPTVVADVSGDARLAREEVFGPVLAMIRASSWGVALRIANDTEYGLTGGVFSRRRDRLDEAGRTFHVGNLYLNRKVTGALVGVQPFGGFNLSGTDVKTGAPDYLRAFLQMKTVTERF